MIGQMIVLQDRPVVHLQPHSEVIWIDFGGELLELVDAPLIIKLSRTTPRLDSLENPCSVDIKKLGPSAVNSHRPASI